MIRANMALPMSTQVPRALGWILNYLYTGTLFRIYRASHRYGLALTHFQILLIYWLAASAVGGWLAVWLVERVVFLPPGVGFLVGRVVAIPCFSRLPRAGGTPFGVV